MSSSHRQTQRPQTQRRSVVFASLLALSLAGCAQNAVLELYVEVPALNTMIGSGRAGGVRISVARPGIEPADSTARSRVFGLDGPDALVPIAIDRGDMEAESISVEIAYCANDENVGACGTVLGVERLTIRRPFYTGVATCYVRRLPRGAFVLSPPQTVSECEVGGCFGSALGNVNFCGREDMPATHYCNTTREGDFCDALRASLTPQLLQ